MSNINSYRKSINLKGAKSRFTFELALDDLDVFDLDIEGEHGDVVEAARMKIVLRFEEEGEDDIVQERSVSVWADEVFEMLDFSVCLAHLAARTDTTEELSDLERQTAGTYLVHRPMWESFMGCTVLLSARDTPRFRSMRALDFFFSPDENASSLLMQRSLCASPEDVRLFAAKLRQIYEEFQNLISGP